MEPKVITYTASTLEFILFQITNATSKLALSDGHRLLMAYIFLYGGTNAAIKNLIKDGHYKSEKSMENYLTQLRKLSLVVDDRLHKDLYLTVDPVNLYFNFQVIDETNTLG